jgi:hypothetical protein
MFPSYIRALLKAKPSYMQLLAFLDSWIGIKNKFNAFYTGLVSNVSLIDSPMIAWNIDTIICNNAKDILVEVYDILKSNLATNKFYKKYSCLLELPNPILGVPILPAEVVSNIMDEERSKGIATNSMSVNPHDPDLHILQDVTYHVPVSRKRSHELFSSGILYCRRQLIPRESFLTDVQGVSKEEDLTLENIMFPFQFPFQKCYFIGNTNLSDYFRYRCQHVFSPFTLYKPYALLMH